MEEKERYSWYNHSSEEIYDNKENIVFVGVITVLNQQNRRIWELVEENKQLKQQLKQSQNQLAIKILKELRDKFCNIGYNGDYDIDYFEVMKEIDDKINFFKGER